MAFAAAAANAEYAAVVTAAEKEALLAEGAEGAGETSLDATQGEQVGVLMRAILRMVST